MSAMATANPARGALYLRHIDEIRYARRGSIDTLPLMTRADWRSLSWLYTRIGSTTFGGGDPTMAALQQELFERKWLDREEYGLVYALARATPGTNILAFCAGTGWLALGIPGALLAVAGASIGSAIVVTFLTAGYVVWRENPWAMSAIDAMLAAATGLMGVAAYSLLKPQFRPERWLRAAVIFGAALLLALRFGLTPIQILGLAALAGAMWPVAETKR